jgi:3-phosphoshikimate 1-carboxyvinyltransferase
MSESPRQYPHKLEVKPLTKPPVATVRVPGSKSITNRALELAALACGKGVCRLSGMLLSEDTEVMVAALRQLGFSVAIDERETGADAVVRSTNPLLLIPAREADLFAANSGTSMRFLAAMVSLGQGRYRLDGSPRMRERPIEDLLSALRQLGVDARSELGTGFPPVVVETTGLLGGEISIRGEVSSQFLSGLLMAAPLAQRKVTIHVDGPLVSQPYVRMTVEMIRRAGAEVRDDAPGVYFIPGGQQYSVFDCDVEPDASAASYFFGAAAIAGGRISLPGLHRSSLQGDVGFVDILERMGCGVTWTDEGATLSGGPLRGKEVEMNAISDTVMTLAAVACFAEGPTTIFDVAHIRYKETDRLAAIATELRRCGAEAKEFGDGLKITPGPLHGAEVETYNDHRIAMSMALLGLRVPGIVIKNPGCVAKTYPGFWEDLERLRNE